MTLPSHFWSDLKTTDFARLDAAHTVAVLPVAATEQHGPHLPLSVDTDIVNGVVAAAIPHLTPTDSVLFLPTQQVGKSNEHQAFAGTLSFSAQTTIATWMEIGASVVRAGVKKLLLFNAHGGQVSLMDIVARDLRVTHNILTVHTSWDKLPMGSALEAFSPHEQRFGVHGGEVETSMMLALKPHLVDMRQAQNFKSASEARAKNYAVLGNGYSAKLGWMMQDYNPQGACGNAAAATAEKGQTLLDAAGLGLANLVREMALMIPPALGAVVQ